MAIKGKAASKSKMINQGNSGTVVAGVVAAGVGVGVDEPEFIEKNTLSKYVATQFPLPGGDSLKGGSRL